MQSKITTTFFSLHYLVIYVLKIKSLNIPGQAVKE